MEFTYCSYGMFQLMSLLTTGFVSFSNFGLSCVYSDLSQCKPLSAKKSYLIEQVS
jgi:hypothetical protein